MPNDADALWISACAHHLQRRWRTVDPEQLEEVAADLARDPWLRVHPPDRAAGMWLEPVAANGILARISGVAISDGSRQLPAPGPDQPAKLTAEVTADGLGRVRLTYALSSSRHNKSVNWFWRAVYAEPLLGTAIRSAACPYHGDALNKATS